MTSPGDLTRTISPPGCAVLEDVGCILVENRTVRRGRKGPPRVDRHRRPSSRRGDLAPRPFAQNRSYQHLPGLHAWDASAAGRRPKPSTLRARALFERLAADFPDLPLYQVGRHRRRARLGRRGVETGRRSAAEKSCTSRCEQSERLAAAHPDLVNCRRTLLAALTRLCSVLREQSGARRGGGLPTRERGRRGARCR